MAKTPTYTTTVDSANHVTTDTIEDFTIVEANSTGVEYRTNEKIDGEWVYARTWKLASPISSTITFTTIETGLKPIFPFFYGGASYDYFPYQFSTGDFFAWAYNPTTGDLKTEVSNARTMAAGTLITLRYTKP